MKTDNSPPRGTRDLLPADVAARDHVLQSITEIYRGFGYQRIETPALEDIKRLKSKQGGENESLIFEVMRRGLPERIEAHTPASDLTDLGLRYDLTVPLTRFYGNNHAALPLPFRSFQVGPVWRAERPQKNRYRQFHQCDIDIIGEPGVLAEAEMMEATTQALAAVGLEGVTVRLSDRRVLSALARAAGVPVAAWDGFFIILDKLDKIGWSGVRDKMTGSGIPAEAVGAVADAIGSLRGTPSVKLGDALSGALPGLDERVVEDLTTTAACLDDLTGERDLAWEFDPTLVRGMGYYTGQIFEVSHPLMTSSVAGGGRYDALVGRSLGREMPACGFSIGFERIVALLDRKSCRNAVAVLADADVPAPEVLAVARSVRGEGRVVETVRRSGKIATQLSRLEQTGFAAFVRLRNQDGLTVRDDERSLGVPAAETREQ